MDSGETRTSPAQPVRLQIIATSETGTRVALVEARQLSRRLNVNRTVLLVLRIGSTASLEGPVNDAAVREDYLQMAAEAGVDVTVMLYVCSRFSDVFQWMLPRGSVVVVGGRRRWWWPTREQQIADQLKRFGHVVVFANASASADASL